MNIDSWYSGALASIMEHGHREINRRTGVECAALPGMTFQTDLEAEGFPVLSLRKIPVKNFVAEQCWFLSGSEKVADLEPYTKIWSSFAEEDGGITSAYGMRWRKWFLDAQQKPIDQLETVLLKLRDDPTTRHGVVMMWDPEMDLTTPQKNVPCPYTFTLMIIGGRLHLHLTVRSNDMVLGFPTDVAGFALLQMMLAQDLGVRPGVYTHSISNAHVYANHYEAAQEMRNRYFTPGPGMSVRFELPEGSYRRACEMDPKLIATLCHRIVSQYMPLPAIGGLVIAL